jgi:hypothetical protein
MTSTRESRKVARQRRRAERQAARARRAVPGLLTTPDDAVVVTQAAMSAANLRRQRSFVLLERCCADLVAAREALSLSLRGAAPGTRAHSDLAREIEALNDELDELRELGDELLRQVKPLVVPDARLAELEGVLASARALGNASARAKALLGAAQRVLDALENALG